MEQVEQQTAIPTDVRSPTDVPGPPGLPVPPDLPVEVSCREPLRSELSTWLESDVGWQVVSGRGALRPVARLTDDEEDASGDVLVRQGPSAPAVAQRAVAAAAVVAWPHERARLIAAVVDLATTSTRPEPGAGSVRLLAIAGAGGGAGTSTVVWALAALAAWRGARALVVGADDLLCLAGLPGWSGPDVGDLVGLGPADAAAEAAALAAVVPGVPGLLALGWSAGRRPGPRAARTDLATLAAADGWSFDVVVADLGTELEHADVVVAEPDARTVAAALPASRLVVRRPGPLSRPEATRLLGGRPRGWIEEDPRVRRAGARAQVPNALPGRWLRQVGAAVAGRPPRRRRGATA